MNQPIFLRILRIVVVMTRGYLKSYNDSLLIYMGCVIKIEDKYSYDNLKTFLITK